MHHFVSIDFHIVAALCTAPFSYFNFVVVVVVVVETFLTLMVGIASAFGLADMTVLFFLHNTYPRVVALVTVNVYFANCIRQPERKLPRPI